MDLRTLEIKDLSPATHNPNEMDVVTFDALSRSIGLDGFRQPILVNEYGGRLEIIDGHHRVEVLARLEQTTVPAVVVSLTPEKAALARIAMNRLRGELNLAKVGAILDELRSSGMSVDDLESSGLSSQEIQDLIVAHQTPEEINLPGTTTVDDESDHDDRPVSWILEIPFATLEDFERAKKSLRRAAGRGTPLATGLLKILGQLQDGQKQKPKRAKKGATDAPGE